jgi:hypothetical protein
VIKIGLAVGHPYGYAAVGCSALGRGIVSYGVLLAKAPCRETIHRNAQLNQVGLDGIGALLR